MEDAPVAVGKAVSLTHPLFQRMNPWYADRNKFQAGEIRVAEPRVLPRMFRPMFFRFA
jgi:hypothetical protein